MACWFRRGFTDVHGDKLMRSIDLKQVLCWRLLVYSR